ncbi:hypothetical protein PPL_02335 [Heterostelium album PN500]|uniref:Uncharacterized protein n=1 Tax=Heterostelium pallidum (strain ATCC 26659 / Pp 5 / PN500) TaxID=670386 RepID=D3B209_HETP5|nr:hypothetical protein PPL_02335 [Heterostelium album PN500]EFA85333.1 hypothetical protein PPL_02335 [Heterostelium album PN500]|eukprot:XP_020437442.1 hypothetical protein PPL_02335 [Heterostelium album PN500]
MLTGCGAKVRIKILSLPNLTKSSLLVTLWFPNLSSCIYPRSKRLCYVTAYSGCTLTPSPSTTRALVMSVSSVVTPSLNSATYMSISSSNAGILGCWWTIQILSRTRHYYQNTASIIFVIDATNYERVSEVQEEIAKLTTEESFSGTNLLLFLNKQDQPNAINFSQMIEQLRLMILKIENTTTGAGIFEGLDWLSQSLKK